MSEIEVEPGEFPFPLIERPEESRYLTWVRNHSNYMAERGFLDYMRILAVLVRGILINFLTVLPWLLGFALVIGAVYRPLLLEWDGRGGSAFGLQEEWGARLQSVLGTSAPFFFTPWVAALTLLWFLIFPAVIRLFKVATHTRSLATGSESSVKTRDRYERSFGGGLLLLAGVAAVEATPYLVHYFHALDDAEIRELVAGATGAGSVVAVSAAGKLLSVLKTWARAIATALIGLLGMALPMLVVLYVVEYLVYAETELELGWPVLLFLPVTIVLGLVVALFLGTVKGALRHWGWLLAQLAGAAALVVALLLWGAHLPGGEWLLVLALASEIWAFCWLAVDVNLTSVHGLYRDRLASAYLVGEDRGGDVDVEEDLDLREIAEYEAGSVAPCHLINVALNLQASKRMEVRERNSEFFIFSKRFIGGRFTGYCRSELMESVFPQIDLATAMAISAAAASPNMGTFTSRPLVAMMTLFNVRLGYWVPNPGALEHRIAGRDEGSPIQFEHVFARELEDVQARWRNVGYEAGERTLAPAIDEAPRPTPRNGLLGIGFSGGGIRSATINLGIVQALDARGVLKHADYLSTVSGGGYLGASLSTLMRRRHVVWSQVRQELRRRMGAAEFTRVFGAVRVVTEDQDRLVLAAPDEELRKRIEDDFGRLISELVQELGSAAKLAVEVGAETAPAPRAAELEAEHAIEPGSLHDRFRWRVRPRAFLREILGLLHERHRWVNLSDGGHIENLATIELLRRRCKFIITGDGAGDPAMHFGGLATLVRYARIDLGIRIDVSLDELRLDERGRSKRSCALGIIRYPNEPEPGYLLYLKSAFQGDEDEVIQEYRNRNPLFPHESTADQAFDEGQFEAYRALGQHIGESVLAMAPRRTGELSYAEVHGWFEALSNGLHCPWKTEGGR